MKILVLSKGANRMRNAKRAMRRVAMLAALVPLACSCSHALGYAGSHPGYVKCTGKGTISGQGAAMAGAGIAGGELNGFSLIADCGSGFEFSQGMPPASGTPVTPVK